MLFFKRLIFSISLLGLFAFPCLVRAEDESDINLGLSTSIELHEAWAEEFKAVFPESLYTTRFLLADYQWIGCFVLIFLGFVADLSVRKLMTTIVRWLRRDYKQDDTPDDHKRERKVWKPVGLLVQAFVWYWGAVCIGLPFRLLLIGSGAL